MLNKWEVKEIINFTKTPTWNLFKKLFQEKKDWVLDYMQTLDVDNDEQRKIYKNKKLNLDSFDSLISEIENLETEKKNEEKIEEYNKWVDDYINWNEEEKIDKQD